MSPASARALRRRRVADLRAAEPGLSLRKMAHRLGVSRDTVRRDLDDIDQHVAQNATPPSGDATPGTPAEGGLSQTAPQASEGGAADSATPAAAGAHDAPLPSRVADPLAGMDVSQWRALRRDLAVLAQTGHSPEALVHQAVVALAFHYRRALDRGDLEPGRPFLVSSMTLRPAAVPERAR